jgi:putative tryptophan/tyrosine transport system substrate-binding protein
MRLIGLAVVLILSLGLAPLSSEAQPAGKVVTIGILAIEAFSPIDSFRQRLRELGYIEDKNVQFEYRYAEGRNQRFRELAEDLVALKVNVILTWGTEAALEAKRATKTIPIVMGAMGDPVGQGVVSSLAHPGGNVTGLTSLSADLEGKRLEILKEIVPNLSVVAVLSNPTTRYAGPALQRMRQAAEMLQIVLKVHEAHDAASLDSELDRVIGERSRALLVLADTFLEQQRRRIAQFALKARLPSVYTFREHVEVGGLVSYAPSYHDLFRSAIYVDKILKGAKPGDLPIEQPTKFELVINLKTAKALGLQVPQSLWCEPTRSSSERGLMV